MGYILYLHPFALQDLKERSSYYEEQEQGLGKRFEREVKEIFDLIEYNPYLFREIGEGYRRGLTKKFDSTVIFKVSGNRVAVYSILHQSTNPTKWDKRKDLL